MDNKTNINWYPGHMAKTKREIQEKIDLIDLVYEVIDSRIPKSSKNNDLDQILKNKPHIIIMTKYDLCDKNKTNKWIKEYEEKGNVVLTLDLINKPDLKKLLSETEKIQNEMNEKRKQKGLQSRKIRILVVGIPNVGKSTLINRLVGRKATNVGNKPGITKQMEWIRINDKIELLDTPGILWPKFDNERTAKALAATTAIKEEILDNEEIAIFIIKNMLKYYPTQIKSRYNITAEEDIVDILDCIGKKIGAIRNKETDYEKVYVTVLKDLREGYLGPVTFDEKE